MLLDVKGHLSEHSLCSHYCLDLGSLSLLWPLLGAKVRGTGAQASVWRSWQTLGPEAKKDRCLLESAHALGWDPPGRLTP